MTEESQVDSCLTTPIENTASSNFAWAKRQKKIVPPRLSGLRTSRSHRMQTHEPEPPSVLLQAEANLESETREKDQLTSRGFGGIHNRAVQEHKMWHNRLDSFDASELYEPQEFLAVRKALLFSISFIPEASYLQKYNDEITSISSGLWLSTCKR